MHVYGRSSGRCRLGPTLDYDSVLETGSFNSLRVILKDLGGERGLQNKLSSIRLGTANMTTRVSRV
jgi:hypothetical protein